MKKITFCFWVSFSFFLITNAQGAEFDEGTGMVAKYQKAGREIVLLASVPEIMISSEADEKLFSREDENGNLTLQNGLVEINLIKKDEKGQDRAYWLKGFFRKDGAVGNLISDLYLHTLGKDGKETYEYHGWIIKTAKPEIRREKDSLICAIKEDWPFFAVTKTIKLFKGKPYAYLRYEMEAAKEFDCKSISFHLYSGNKAIDTRAFRSPKGIEIFTHKGNKEWYGVDGFTKGKWLAYYNSGAKEGVSLLFPDLERWNNFIGRTPLGCDREAGFSIGPNLPSSFNRSFKPGEKVILDVYLLAFKGDPRQESEKILEEISKRDDAGQCDSNQVKTNLATCVKTNRPPVIDGKLDDACWKTDAVQITGFTLLYGKTPSQQTTVFIVRDDKMLYLAFICDESQIKEIKSTVTKRDGEVWRDDCVEIFLDTNHDHVTHYHLLANPQGVKRDESWVVPGMGQPVIMDAGWDADWNVKTAIGNDRWIVEMAIPFDDLGAKPEKGDVWGFNLTRGRRGKGAELNEDSCWSNTEGDFNNPVMFGHLVFGNYSPSVERFSLGEMDESYSVKAKVMNKGEKTIKVEVKTDIFSVAGEYFSGLKEIELRAEEAKQVEIPYRINKEEKQFLCFSLLNSETKEIYYRFVSPLISTGGMKPVSPQILAKNEDCFIWREGSTRKVFKEQRVISGGKVNNTVALYAAKGEYEPFQLVINPGKDIRKVRLEFSDLGSSGGKISRDNIKYNPVGYVNIESPSDAFSHLGFWPDPLLEEQEFDAVSGENTPVWITIYVPRDATAGDYLGTVKIKSENSEDAIINLKLTVWDFTLPVRSHLKTHCGFWDFLFSNYYDIKRGTEDFNKLVRKYEENFLQHRISFASLRNDEHAQWAFNNGLNSFLFRTVGGFWSRSEIKLSEESGEGPKKLKAYGALDAEVLRERIKKEAAHLDEKGWLKDGCIMVGHEPLPDDKACEEVKAISILVREADPRIKQLSSFCGMRAPDPRYYGYTDIWCPEISWIDLNRAKERQALGEEVWWYVACGTKYPHPSLWVDGPAINHRIIFWMNWKYNVTGFLYWSATAWNINPWKSLWQYNTNGDGILLYPGKEGPVNSIRWELMREGIEDYDYLAILKEKIEHLEVFCQKKGITKYNDLIEQSKKLLEIDDSFIKSTREYTQDPEKIYQAREKIGTTIDKINGITGGIKEE